MNRCRARNVLLRNRALAMEATMKHTILMICIAGAVAAGAATFAFAQVVPNVQGGQATQLERVPVTGHIMGPPAQMKNPYAGNREAWMEGKKLFQSLNCAGCHGPGGGGGMGPPLSDKVWKYGGSPGQIYLSILHGRPNGMPQWGAVLPPKSIWALVTYVETLSEPNPEFEPTTKLGAQPAPTPGGNPAPRPPGARQPPPNPKKPATPTARPAHGPAPHPASSSSSGRP